MSNKSKFYSKKYTLIDVVLFFLIASAMIGGIIWFIKTPAKTHKECTAEYVRYAGDEDCQYKKMNDEAESDAYQEESLSR